MEISKGLQLEIRSVQSKLKNAIRDHQICVGKLKDDPNNADILERIQEIQVHIVSLGRCQKQVVQRLRKEVDDYKAANANEVKVSVATLLGINNNNHITANNESTNDDISEVKVATNGLDNVRLINAKEDYEDIVRNGEVTSPRENLLKKERSISVETLSADDEEVIEVAMDGDTRETKRQMSEEPLDERKIKCTEQLSFLEVLGLITTLRSTELQNRRAERKRRSTANPQFVYSNWEMPTKRKRHSYLQSAGNVPQTRQTTARLNGPSPPPICNKSANSVVPPKSTSPPTRTSTKSLIPIQKASTRPNILRNMSESRVFPNKNNRIENGNGQLQLSSLTSKTNEPTTNSKAVHIPGLPSGLTIERIEHDSAVCINCRNPGTLTSCDNCEANYHVSCHSISPPPPSICPKCAVKMKYSTGAIKKNDELVAASYAPGVAGKAGQDPEINKASGGFYKIGPNAKQQQQQQHQTVPGECGINESSGTSIVEPIPSKPVDKSDYVIAAFGGSEVYLVGSNGVNVTEKGSLSPGESNAIDYKVSGASVTPASLSGSGVGFVRNFSFVGDTRIKKNVEESRVERGSNEGERIAEPGQNVSRRSECNDEPGKIIPGNDLEPGNIDSKIDNADVNGIKLTGSSGTKKTTIRAIPGLTRIVPSTDNDKSQSIKTEHSDNDNMGELQRGKYGCNEKFVDLERNDNERKFGKYENTGEPSRKEQTTATTATESLFSRDKYRPKFGSILHSLFTGYNKPDSVSLRNDEPRSATSSSRDNEIFGSARERYHERANDDISGRRKIVGSGEHVKLEEAHLSAPSRAMLMRNIDDNVEKTRNDDRAGRIFAGGAMFSARRRTTEDEGTNFAQRGIRDYGRNERRQLPRILMRPERKSLESRDAMSNDKLNFSSSFANKYSRSLLKMPQEETTKVPDNDCNSGGDTSATEDANSPIMFPDDGQSLTTDDRKNDIERKNGDDVVNNENEDDNNTRGELEIDEETDDNEEVIDDEEHQDCPIVEDDIRQGANLGVRIGTISPESMKVLELFENAMMQVENGDKTANP